MPTIPIDNRWYPVMQRYLKQVADMERLVTRAWRERITVLVIAPADAPHVPIEIVLLRLPREDR